MIEYYSIVEDSMADLEKELNALANDGWRCVGYTCSLCGDGYRYTALVEREK